jgi:hypothetical protein
MSDKKAPKAEPRTWAFTDKEAPKILAWLKTYGERVKAEQGRFERRFRKLRPDLKGVTCTVKVNRAGKPYVEEARA